MPISSSGPIKFSDLQTEYGGSNAISLSEYVIGGFNIPISLWNPNNVTNSGNRGYFGGGNTGSAISSIDGIQFSDETAINPAATLAVARFNLAGVQSSTRGYFCGGGSVGSLLNEIDGIQFSDETAINPAATIAVARFGIAGVQSSARGYFGGGYTTTAVNEIDGIQFSDETAINPAATLAVARYYLAGVSSSIRGYFGGGTTGTNSSEIDGIQFSDETAINPSATLTVARSGLAGVSSSIRGYFGGGSASGNNNEIDGIQFSNETAINPAATLPIVSTRYHAGVSNRNINYVSEGDKSSNKGYFAGGVTQLLANSSEIDGILFSSETATNPVIALSAPRPAGGSYSSPVEGYIETGNILDVIYRDVIRYSDETLRLVSATSDTFRGNAAGVSSSLAGYLGGGEIFSETNLITKFIFSTETTSLLATTLVSNRYTLAGLQSLDTGFFVGGVSGATRSTEVDGVNFSNDSLNNPTAVLKGGRGGLTGVSSLAAGYIGGGDVGSATTEIEKLTFSSTPTMSDPSAALSVARQGLGGVNSAVRGYWGGGSTGSATTTEIDGIQFSDDTAINPSAVLAFSRFRVVGISNGEYHYNGGLYDIEEIRNLRGYFGGGVDSFSYLNTIDGIQFSDETAVKPSATLAEGRTNPAAVQSSIRGYFGGGSTTIYLSQIDGIQFSNETAINPSAALVVARGNLTGASSSTRGYFVGGVSPSISSEIDLIRFLDETIVDIAAVLTLGGRSNAAGTQSSTRGYFAGGEDSPSANLTNKIDRIEFSSEAVVGIAATLKTARTNTSAVQSSTRSYFGGGSLGGTSSEIDGIQFSDESAIDPSAALSIARTGIAGVSSSIRGYFGGGYDLGTTFFNEIDGIEFSGETATNTGTALSTSRHNPAGTQSSTYLGGLFFSRTLEPRSITFANNRGYFGGGFTTVAVNKIDGIQFSNETVTSPVATLSVARKEAAGVSSSVRGYFAGGNAGSYSNEIDGIQFSDETAINPTATLAVARSSLAGVSSSIRGYFGGGYTGSNSTEIDGIQFSDETAINPTATLAVARNSLAGVSSSIRGYFGGGAFGSYSNEIDGIQFSDETAINPTATLAVARNSLAGVQSSTRGYFGGGYTGAVSSEIDGIQFSDETAINPTATLAVARETLAGVSSSIRGYFGGGYTSAVSSEIDGIQFSNETAIDPTATLAVARVSVAGVSSKISNLNRPYVGRKGYVGGGANNSVSGTNSIYSIDLSTEMTTLTSVTLADGARSMSGGLNSTEKGYWVGGFSGSSVLNVIDGISFITETSVNPSATVAANRRGMLTASNTDVGIYAGGDNSIVLDGSSTPITDIDGLIFSSETAATINSVLVSFRMSGSGLYSKYNGYFCGGNASSTGLSSIEKINFSTYVITNLGNIIGYSGLSRTGVSSEVSGYLAGGLSVGTFSGRIDVVAFADDTSSTSSSTLSTVRTGAAGNQSTTTGYVTGGETSSGVKLSSIEAINYTTQQVYNAAYSLSEVRGDEWLSPTGVSPLNTTTQELKLSNFRQLEEGSTGYIAGGQNDTPGAANSTITKYNLSNRTQQNLAFNLAEGSRSHLAGANSPTRGYFAGGSTTLSYVADTAWDSTFVSVASIDGIKFSDDTSINPAVTLQDGAREKLAAANSLLKAFFVGGVTGITVRDFIDGMTFSDESYLNVTSVLPDGARGGLSGLSSSTKGYFAGGGSNPNSSIPTRNIDAIDFSTNATTNPTAILTQTGDGGRLYAEGVNSSTKGYWMGGMEITYVPPAGKNPGYYSNTRTLEIDGILFSNETAINPSAQILGFVPNITSLNTPNEGLAIGTQSSNSTLFSFTTETSNVLLLTLSSTDAEVGSAGVQSGWL